VRHHQTIRALFSLYTAHIYAQMCDFYINHRHYYFNSFKIAYTGPFVCQARMCLRDHESSVTTALYTTFPAITFKWFQFHRTSPPSALHTDVLVSVCSGIRRSYFTDNVLNNASLNNPNPRNFLLNVHAYLQSYFTHVPGV
jgi:hypothetical protein